MTRTCDRCARTAAWRYRFTQSGNKFGYRCDTCFATSTDIPMNPPYAQHKSWVKEF